MVRTVVVVALLLLLHEGVCGFFVISGRARKSTLLASSSSSMDTKQVLTREDVLNVAAFRNDLTNPQMMVENAKNKLSRVDNTKAAVQGLITGFGYIGVPLFAYDYSQSQNIFHALQFAGSVGGTIGVILAVNSYMGRSVYVPSVEESENRILVDFAEGLLRKQDIGFVAMDDNDRFVPCGRVMACVDAQLRNSDDSWPGLPVVPDLPPHLHVKNMEVHPTMRRKGVGTALLDALETHARQQTNAKLMTLEVDPENVGAIALYEGGGFRFEKNPTAFTRRKFMMKEL